MTTSMTDLIAALCQHRYQFAQAVELQLSLWNGETPQRPPLLLHCALDEDDGHLFPSYNTKEIHYDKDKMFTSQLRQMMTSVYGGAEAVPSVRANMGCGIFPTLFGIKQELFADKMPWVVEHLPKEVLAKMGPEDLKIGDEFKAGLDHMAFMAEQLDGTGCMVYPMDLQGTFDTAHLVYGDAIFYDLYDDPQFVHHLLDLCCEAIFMGMDECLKIIPDSQSRIAHYNNLVMPRSKGGIKTSEDTSTLLSREHLDEFVVPYLHRVLEHFGGGYVHYCGSNEHLFEVVMNEPCAFGINFGNPEYHEMDEVLKRCAAEGKIYYGSIPKVESATLEDYFARYLAAAKVGGSSLLLLNYGCAKDEREETLEAWEKAARSVGVM